MTDIRREASVAIPCLVLSMAVLFHFHDQFWWPIDEGVYAYVAQRANAGDVIHRDLIDLHGGYGNALNAWAFRIFGEDLLSLRYPLVALALVQSMIAFILLRKRGLAAAFVAAFAVTAFSFVQFPNPSANWHALGAFFCLCLCLERLEESSCTRLLIAGGLVGLCFFTRQLSGVLLGLGLVCVLLSEAIQRPANGSRAPAILIGGISFAGLLGYLLSKGDVFGFVWAGIWPLGLLLLTMLRVRMTLAYAARTVGLVLAGFVLAGLPLAVTALSQGSLLYWLRDTFLTALIINGQAFISQASYLTLVQIGLQNIVSGGHPIAYVSALFWLFLVLSVPMLGIYVWRDLARTGRVPATAILSVFWATTSLHYQIPIYLMFVLSATFMSLVLIRPNASLLFSVAAASVWALGFQAGQPLERNLHGIVAGTRSAPNVAAELPRVSLKIQGDDAAVFRQVIETIEAGAGSDELLMTLPMDPELNFITGRASPVPYYGTPLGLRLEADVDATVDALDEAAPLFVVHRRSDKYLTPLSAVLLEAVREGSSAPQQIGPFDLYRYLGSSPERAFFPGR